MTSKNKIEFMESSMNYNESLKKLEDERVIVYYGGIGGSTIKHLHKGKYRKVLIGKLDYVWRRPSDNGFNFIMGPHITFNVSPKENENLDYEPHLSIEEYVYEPGNYENLVGYSSENLETRISDLGYTEKNLTEIKNILNKFWINLT